MPEMTPEQVHYDADAVTATPVRRPIIRHLGRGQKTLLAILFISLVTRLILVLRGGEFYFPDETRYLRSFVLLQRLAHLNLRDVCDEILTAYNHVGFIFIGLP